ncbi:MAG: OmpA family protein, partial [Proteobacteria bacterium]|nr:OmpA family protein [Pseudomonadota bacterium]
DRILDVVDDCPLDPEDIDGFEDEDGCPDLDNDGDGYADLEDRCPNEAEDFDTFEDLDGCADIDNDNDRILDVVDDCPMEPEVLNGIDDEDGCPDEGLVEVNMDLGQIIIMEKVFFETASDRIRPVSFEVLNAVHAVMEQYPQITLVEVQGHTDSRGSDDYNLDLSARRAKSVRIYLEERGIDSDRLISFGYGETKPLDEAENEDAWEMNRRVQFQILEMGEL